MTARWTTLGLLLFLLPSFAMAATFAEKRDIVLSDPPPDNAYLAGTNVTIRTQLPADLAAAAAFIGIDAPVTGDVLVGGGTVNLNAPVSGDLRAVAGRITIDAPVGGDIVAAGGTIRVSGTSRDMRLFGGTVNVTNGSKGLVTIYGADVNLSGDFAGDVEVFASDHFTVGENTHIRGVLRYNAPQQVEVPATAVIDGGTTYTGSYSYVPTNAEAKKFALFGAGIFFIVRALALMIAAGLLVGLLPIAATTLVRRTLQVPLRRSSLTALLGFGIIVATPVFIVLLIVSVVGIGIALVLGLLYLLTLVLAYLYAGALTGAAIRRTLSRKKGTYSVSWRDAAFGMLAFFLVGSIPFVGGLITLVLLCLALGGLVMQSFRSALPPADDTLAAL